MDTNLKNSFNNILLSAGNVIEYLASLKSKNLIVPNNRLDKNSNPTYNGLISSLNSNINVYNAVLDEFVVDLNDTEKLLGKVKIRWTEEDANKASQKLEPASIVEQQQSSVLPQQQQQQQQQHQQQEQDSVQEPQGGLSIGNDINIDDDAYLNQFLQGDVTDNGMEANGLLDFSNAQVSAKQEETQDTSKNSNINDIDGNKNPSDILYGGSSKPQPPQPQPQPQQQQQEFLEEAKIAKDDDINLDDLEELLASTNDPNDLTYDSNGVPIDDNNIFDELNYFLGGDGSG